MISDKMDVIFQKKVPPPNNIKSEQQSVRSNNKAVDLTASQMQIQMQMANILKTKVKDSEPKNVAKKNQFSQDQIVLIVKLQRKIKRRRGDLQNNNGIELKFSDDYKKMKKRFIYRKHVIAEILNTETLYVNDLKCIIEKIMSQVVEEGVLDGNQMKKCFLNIDQIIGVNNQLLIQLQQKIQRLEETESKRQQIQPYFVLFDTTVQLIPYFKLYFEYCKEYSLAQTLRGNLKQQNKKYSEFLVKLRKQPFMKGMDIEDFLVKPIQRLPKYVLLFKDLLKNTDEDHPDYQNIKETLKQFEQINIENNQFIEEYMLFFKMSELQKIIGKRNKETILKSNRKFIMEETFSLYTQQREILSVLCYFFNDLIVVTARIIHNTLFHKPQQDQQYQLKKMIHLSYNSQCTRVKQQNYPCMFKVVGNKDLALFIAHDEQSMNKSIQQIQDIIKALQEKREARIKIYENLNLKGEVKDNFLTVEVQVLGTEEHEASTIKSYTVYIIEITVLKIKQKIYLRFSEITEIEHLVRKKNYPNVKIQKFTDISWIKNHQSRVLQQRIIEIEAFLSVLLNSPDIQMKSDDILGILGLPKNFFQNACLFEDQQQLLMDNSQIHHQIHKASTVTVDDINMFLAAQQTPLIVQLQEKFNKKLHDLKLYQKFSDPDNGKTVKIRVFLMDGGKQENQVSINIKAIQFCELVAQQIGLDQYHDFRLFIYDQKNNYRIIEDDQILPKALPKVDSNIWCQEQQILDLISQKLNIRDQHSLVFRKYIFYPSAIERELYQNDRQRLSLISKQYLLDVHFQTYPLNHMEYCQLAAFYLYINHEDDQQDIAKLDIDLDKVKQYITSAIYDHQTNKYWRQCINQLLSQLSEKLIQVRDQNQEQNLENLYVDLTSLACMALINHIERQNLFGSNLFYVGISNKIEKQPKTQDGEILPKNLWLVVYHKKIALFSPSKKRQYVEINILDICNIQCRPNCIQYDVDGQEVKLRTCQGYIITQLIIEYQELLDQVNRYEQQ